MRLRAQAREMPWPSSTPLPYSRARCRYRPLPLSQASLPPPPRCPPGSLHLARLRAQAAPPPRPPHLLVGYHGHAAVLAGADLCVAVEGVVRHLRARGCSDAAVAPQ